MPPQHRYHYEVCTYVANWLKLYIYYLKRQKLNERKVLQFTGFHPNVGKTFAGLASSVLKVLKKAIAIKVHHENFRVLSKIHESRMKATKLLSSLTLLFTVLPMHVYVYCNVLRMYVHNYVVDIPL